MQSPEPGGGSAGGAQRHQSTRCSQWLLTHGHLKAPQTPLAAWLPLLVKDLLSDPWYLLKCAPLILYIHIIYDLFIASPTPAAFLCPALG